MGQHAEFLVEQRERGRTQAGLELLHVAPLGAALLANLIVGAVVLQSLAGAARGPGAVAAQLPLPAEHAGDTLQLRSLVLLLGGRLGAGPGRVRVVVVGRLLGQIVEGEVVRRLCRGRHGCLKSR